MRMLVLGSLLVANLHMSLKGSNGPIHKSTKRPGKKGEHSQAAFGILVIIWQALRIINSGL
jgi:hypothetical protein